MNLAAEIILAPPDRARRKSRRLVDFGAFVRGSDAVALKVRVKNLSPEGCRIQGAGDLAEESEIWLKLTGLAPVRARVAWVSDGEAGCEFAPPLHSAVVEELLATTRSAKSAVFGAKAAGPARTES